MEKGEELKAETLVQQLEKITPLYNELLRAYGYQIDSNQGLLDFLVLQCGVLLTAITGNVLVDDPLKEVSPLLISQDRQDLCYLRSSWLVFINAWLKGEREEAFQKYYTFIGGIKKDGKFIRS